MFSSSSCVRSPRHTKRGKLTTIGLFDSNGLYAGTANVDPNDDELLQSDVLAAIPFVGGVNPYSYHARVKNESSFMNATAVQSLELRLTNHRNEPIQNISALTVSWSAVLQVELVINHSIQPAGYGQTPTRVNPKLTGNIYRPL
eukprot:scaffold152924_cov30-Tisochrysis_lutea.AAC.2